MEDLIVSEFAINKETFGSSDYSGFNFKNNQIKCQDIELTKEFK